MKRLFTMMMFIIISVFTFNLSAQDFEGKITFEMYEDYNDDTMRMDYYKKGDKQRLVFSDNTDEDIIYLTDKMIVLFTEEESYSEMSIEKLKEQGSAFIDEEIKLVNTGETTDIIGYECTEWTMKSDNNELTMWLNDELGGFIIFESPAFMNALENESLNPIAGKMPFEIYEMTPDGELKLRMKIIEIDDSEPDDSLFEVPDGFTKKDF